MLRFAQFFRKSRRRKPKQRSWRIKILQIGFNRCGTSSLREYFDGQGIRTLHWDQGKIARRGKERMDRREDPLLDYERRIFISDMEWIEAEGPIIEFYKCFNYLHHWYPDAYFILNTRDREDWIKSRDRLPGYTAAYRRADGLEADEAVFAHWRADWDSHHQAVRHYFGQSGGNLLVFNIDTDTTDTLVDFLRPDFPRFTATPLPHADHLRDHER